MTANENRDDPIPRYAQLDVWMALFGTERSEEYEPYREQHGFAETWARVMGGVRERVSYAKNADAALASLPAVPAATKELIEEARDAQKRAVYYQTGESELWQRILVALEALTGEQETAWEWGLSTEPSGDMADSWGFDEEGARNRASKFLTMYVFKRVPAKSAMTPAGPWLPAPEGEAR